MNGLFEAANIYLHYRGGKHVGLAGLIGVIVAIFIAIMWNDWFQPIVNFIGLNRVAANMGIVVEGAGGATITAYNVLILYLFFCLAFSLILGIGLLVFVYGSTALDTKIGTVLFGTILFVILSPILIWFTISQFKDYNKEVKRMKDNPAAYKEEQRLNKNKELIDHIVYSKEKDGKTNKVRPHDALRYLHRLPSTEENAFLVGITYDREVVLLFPRPFGTIVYGSEHNLLGVTLSFDEFIPMQHDPLALNMKNNPARYYMKYEEKLQTWKVGEIETFILPTNVYDLQRELKTFNKLTFYGNYVNMTLNHYNLNKNKSFSES